jgi:hypothetical protein
MPMAPAGSWWTSWEAMTSTWRQPWPPSGTACICRTPLRHSGPGNGRVLDHTHRPPLSLWLVLRLLLLNGSVDDRLERQYGRANGFHRVRQRARGADAQPPLCRDLRMAAEVSCERSRTAYGFSRRSVPQAIGLASSPTSSVTCEIVANFWAAFARWPGRTHLSDKYEQPLVCRVRNSLDKS